MKNKIIVGSMIVVAIALGIVMAYAQVNPQDQLNALQLRIQKDTTQWQADNSAISSDQADATVKQADADAMNQEITISQESVNAIENGIASAEANAQTNTDNSENMDVQGTISQVGS